MHDSRRINLLDRNWSRGFYYKSGK